MFLTDYEHERLRRLAEVGELAEALFQSGALDDVTLGDARFAELVTRLGRGDG